MRDLWRGVLVPAVAFGLFLPVLQAKPDSEAAILKDVIRDFAKARSYRVEASVQGGFAVGADHQISNFTVNRTYGAEVYATISRVTCPNEAFRGPKGATIQNSDGRWVQILATPEGREMMRLFVRPEDVLKEIHLYRQNSRWLDAEAGTGEKPDPATEAGGGTRAREGLEAGAQPRRILVVGPEETALEHFIRIQNSGCFQQG